MDAELEEKINDFIEDKLGEKVQNEVKIASFNQESALEERIDDSEMVRL